MIDKDIAMVEFKKFNEVREEFFDFFDDNVPKKSNNVEYDFDQNITLDPKTVHELFFKLDYQARKIRALIASELGLGG